MELVRYLRAGAWPTVFGYAFFVALMAGGYYYNVTFVQLGLLDLGTRLVGMSRGEVAAAMGALAVVTAVVAVAVGTLLDRRGWTTDLLLKLRLAMAVVALQFVLTLVAPAVRTVPAYIAWILCCSVSLGVGVPVTFSMTVDFVPVPDRGYVAAAITALAFFAAAVYPIDWQIASFSRVMVAAMAPALVVMGALASGRLRVVDALAEQHREFGVGRFCRTGPVRTRSLAFWTLVVLMFGVFFVDSLGFVRIVEEPLFVAGSWQSPDLADHVFVGAVHVVGALMAGVLYANFGRAALFLWVFGVFSVTHLLSTFGVRLQPLSTPEAGLAMPMLYAVAVSFYTTLNFALWADVSTPATVGRHTAIGVGVAGWVATFLATALALYLEATGTTLLAHLNLVDALALLLLLAVAVMVYLRRLAAYRRDGQWQ